MPYKSQWPNNLQLPETIVGFEDCAFLFTSSNENRGIARVNFDEAAFLWRCTREADAMPGGSKIVEIGRAEGGTTILMAGATLKKRLVSVDNDPVNDDHLSEVLGKLGLRAALIIADSQHMKTDGYRGAVSLLFIDGDHTYKGVRADFDNWFDSVVVGGSIVFHDVTNTGLQNYGPEQLYTELLKDKRVKAVDGAGSMRRLRKVYE